ncbi:M48 family metalloprotease [Myxococcota bacterium]|nr:M48 family metalloprotease [Myxococcota bacterium]
MLAQQLRTSKERTLFAIAAVVSAMAWLAVAITIVGLFYGLFIALFVVIAHALFIAWISNNGVKVGPDQFPEIHARILAASERLGLKRPPEAYVIQAGGALNALATRLFSRDFVILYSDLLDASEDASRRQDPARPSVADFVIGHEVGHLAAGHLKWNAFLLPARVLPWLGPAYSRACEYTCDACGHAVVEDLETSSRALAVLAAGGRHGARVDLDAFVRQREAASGFWASVYELNASHPFLPKRIAALREIAKPGSAPAPARHPLSWPLAPFFAFATGGGGGLGGVMVVFAMVGVLAAIAIPNFVAMQQRAREASLREALEGLELDPAPVGGREMVTGEPAGLVPDPEAAGQTEDAP